MMGRVHWKGRVRMRIQVLYLKIMFMQMSDSVSWVCNYSAEAWKMGISSIFAQIDAF